MRKSLWPLPGGNGQYFITLLNVIRWIQPQGRVPFVSLHAWFCEHYVLDPKKGAAVDYLRVIRDMGFMSQIGDLVVLTDTGQRLVSTGERGLVIDVLLSEYIATYDVLQAVKFLGEADNHRIIRHLSDQFPDWHDSHQFIQRLGWLLSVGCLAKAGREYSLTQLGERVLVDYAHTHAQNVVSARLLARPAPVPQRASSMISNMPHHDALQVAEAVTGARVRSGGHVGGTDGMASKIAAEVASAATASEESARFEKAIAEAFRFLGFDAEHKSGPSETDVLVSAVVDGQRVRAIIDGKSSRHGKVHNQQIEWPALARHKRQNRANWILIVAPDFAAGDLRENAREAQAALLTARGLAQIIEMHARCPLSLDDLMAIFRRPGDPDATVEVVSQQAQVAQRLGLLIPEILRFFEEYHQMDEYVLSLDALDSGLVRRFGKRRYSREEIDEAVSMLCSTAIGALNKQGDKGFSLEMPIKSVSGRFQAIARGLTTQPRESESAQESHEVECASLRQHSGANTDGGSTT